jgi:FYVE/RhoGEF/PH domain-containing protein 5/6
MAHIDGASTGSETSSSVVFPLSESPHKHAPSPLRAPHLPFRRISLPTAPSLLHRVSVVSVASFDSLPEDGDGSPPTSALSNYNGKLGKGRPIHPESPRRRNRLRDTSTKPLDELQTNKRRKVVREFYDTEKAYVDGLDLVYSVSLSCCPQQILKLVYSIFLLPLLRLWIRLNLYYIVQL